ncbi:hypothetical protein NGM36_26225 [Streptomyces mutabilis]|uniref:hypothetical protein n=1 Tax=Streptomyces mutabilis TaxID=67332 RepID=UPI0022BA63C1|nr:hypothetical protein [Streptomyces mutabilis]MCZ9353221.1 hypothetical protein [Streptomyces mutabilis]
MTIREHITEAAGDPAPHRTGPERTGYVTPTYRAFAEAQARAAAEAAADRYRVPETREQLLAMRTADQNRTYLEHRATYDRLMHGGEAA